MSFYLSWAIIPYFVFVVFLLGATFYVWPKLPKKIYKVFWCLALIFMVQFPIHYDASVDQSYRTSFNNTPSFDEESITKDVEEMSMEMQRELEKAKSRKEADQRFNQSMGEN